VRILLKIKDLKEVKAFSLVVMYMLRRDASKCLQEGNNHLPNSTVL